MTTVTLPDWRLSRWPEEETEITIAGLRLLGCDEAEELMAVWDEVASFEPESWSEADGTRANAALLACASRAARRDGLAGLLAQGLVHTVEWRDPRVLGGPAGEEEADRRFLAQRDALRAAAAPHLDASRSPREREVAASVAGGWSSSFARETLVALLALARDGTLGELGRHLLLEIEIPSWTSLGEDWPRPEPDLLPELLSYLQAQPIDPAVVYCESDVWSAILDSHPRTRGWAATIEELDTLWIRIERLLGDPAHATADDGLARAIVPLVLIAFDAEIGFHRFDRARARAAALSSSPASGRLSSCWHSDEVAAVLEVLADADAPPPAAPPPELLRELIATGCYRASLYLTIVALADSPGSERWASADEVTAIKLSFAAAAAHWGRLAVRGLHPIVCRLLLAAAEVPVERQGDVETLNSISIELTGRFDAQRFLAGRTG